MHLAQPSADHRQHPRFPVKWRVVLVATDDAPLPGNELHATTSDVSMGGLSLLSDFNLRQGQNLGLFVQVPASHNGEAGRYVAVVGNVAYTLHDSNAGLFRSGVRFIQFKDNSARDFLAQSLDLRFGAKASGAQPPLHQLHTPMGR